MALLDTLFFVNTGDRSVCVAFPVVSSGNLQLKFSPGVVTVPPSKRMPVEPLVQTAADAVFVCFLSLLLNLRSVLSTRAPRPRVLLSSCNCDARLLCMSYLILWLAMWPRSI